MNSSGAAFSVTAADVAAALPIVRQALPETPVTRSSWLSDLLNREVYIKWDLKFPTGSFKERGAAYTLQRLSIAEPEVGSRGVLVASAGNHALAVARHAQLRQIPCTVVMPEGAPIVKVRRCRELGATVILHGKQFDEALAHAESLRQSSGQFFVPPFEHPWIVAGQGTVALELLAQLQQFDAIVVPIGGGGLCAGIVTVLETYLPNCFVLGVQSAWAVHPPTTGSPVLRPGTIADGIGVKRRGQTTGAIIDRFLRSCVTVSEDEIAEAMVAVLTHERTIVEGAAAAGFAAIARANLPKELRRIVLLACGSNADVGLLSQLISRQLVREGRLVRIRVALPDRPGALAYLAGAVAQYGGNIMKVDHERSFSAQPFSTEVTLDIELRDREHGVELIAGLQREGLTLREIGW